MDQEGVQNQHDAVNDRGDDQDSFYAQEGGRDQDDEKMSSQPQKSNHKQLKSKKKGILKKKEKSSKTSKKSQLPKERQKQIRLSQIAESKVGQIIAKMKACYDLDIMLFQQKKMACKKLNYLEELGKLLKNVYICDKFIEKDGLSYLERWLEKIVVHQQTVEPSVSLRKGILEILLSLTISSDNASKINQIQRLVVRQKRSQIKQLRDLSERIILKWNQLSYEDN